MQEKLNAILGKKFNYRNRNIVIEKTKKVHGLYVVIADVMTMNFRWEEVEIFLSELKEQKTEFVPKKEEIIMKNENQLAKSNKEVYQPTTENITIKATLLETLKKVTEDKDYIPQAQAVCSVVSQIVSVQKAEMQMMSLISKK